MNSCKKLAALMLSVGSEEKLAAMLGMLFTLDEIEELFKRVAILQHLVEGDLPQREMAKKLGASIATITRGSNALKRASTQEKNVIKKLKL